MIEIHASKLPEREESGSIQPLCEILKHRSEHSDAIVVCLMKYTDHYELNITVRGAEKLTNVLCSGTTEATEETLYRESCVSNLFYQICPENRSMSLYLCSEKNGARRVRISNRTKSAVVIDCEPDDMNYEEWDMMYSIRFEDDVRRVWESVREAVSCIHSGIRYDIIDRTDASVSNPTTVVNKGI